MSVGILDRTTDEAAVAAPAPVRRISWRMARRALVRFAIVVAAANGPLCPWSVAAD